MNDQAEESTSEKEPQPRPKTFTFRRTFTFGNPPPDSTDATLVPQRARTFKWEWRGGETKDRADAVPADALPPGALPPDVKPATYYEALSGRRDPMRNFFITARRIIRIGVWVVAIGLPVCLITLAIVTGQSMETVIWVGIGSAIVGLMFAASFPKTPFD